MEMKSMIEPDELTQLKREIEFHKVEIKTLTTELNLTKSEYIIQNIEKQKRAEELIIANKELAFQNEEKHKRAEELIIANKELVFQNEEKHKRAEELLTANKELDLQYKANRKLTTELTIAYNELKKTEEYLRNHIEGLEEMIFMTSHQVRQPIAHILGVSSLLDASANYTPDELKKIVGYVKKSATVLDDFTKELTEFMNKVGK